MKRIMAPLRDCAGNVAVEFALLAPLLILLLAGTIDMGRAVYTDMALETAARGAVQYARQNPRDTAGIRQAALDAGGLDPTAVIDAPAPSCTCPDGSATSCTTICNNNVAPLVYLQVTVQQTYTPLFPYPGLPDPIMLSGEAVLRVQ